MVFSSFQDQPRLRPWLFRAGGPGSLDALSGAGPGHGAEEEGVVRSRPCPSFLHSLAEWVCWGEKPEGLSQEVTKSHRMGELKRKELISQGS